MTKPEHQKEVSDSISRILEETKARRITWTRANPTTFLWTLPASRVILQRLTQQKQVIDPTTKRMSVITISFIMFQGFLLPNNTLMVSLNSSEDTFAASLLEELYKTTEDNLASEPIEFLRKLVPKTTL
jgi:hypothetical protein